MSTGDPPPTAHRVLIVDDDRNVRLMARAALGGAGFKVTEASGGSEGIDAILEGRPDVVLMDVMMPEMSGFEACSRVRKHPALQQLPIIMLTGLDDLESITDAYDAGATDFVTKPVNWELLKHRIHYTLRATDAFRSLANAQRLAALGNWEWSPETGLLTCSAEARRILGLVDEAGSAAESLLLAAVHPEDRERLARERQSTIERGASYTIDYRVLCADDIDGVRHITEQGEATVVDGAPRRLSATVQDVTERRRYEDQIRHMALHDALTGLPNRRMFVESLEEAITLARDDGRRLALLYFDLDGFKLINDTYGHRVGDDVLRAVAHRLQTYLRKGDLVWPIDPDGTMLSRLGGDEFVVLLEDIEGRDDVEAVVRRLKACLRGFRVGDNQIRLSTSIGITVFPDDAESHEALLINADVAMYEAKSTGRNVHRFFTDEMNARLRERALIERELAGALEGNELRLEYQPIYDLASSRFCGVEALLRWSNPELGEIPPSRFIPVAEDSGLILALGDWVLRQACTQASRWIASGLEDFSFSVNVSAYQLRQRNFVERVQGCLEDAGIDPSHLTIELTESILMDDVQGSEQVLADLQALGVSVAIDDFGTGYSSLSYLRRLRPHVLKIDRSFMAEVLEQEDAASLVGAIIAIAHGLGIEVIAEGIEQPSQLRFLEQHGCQKAQGFLLAHPAPPEQVPEFFSEHRQIEAGSSSAA